MNIYAFVHMLWSSGDSGPTNAVKKKKKKNKKNTHTHVATNPFTL